jgi:hypothetical protein
MHASGPVHPSPARRGYAAKYERKERRCAVGSHHGGAPKGIRSAVKTSTRVRHTAPLPNAIRRMAAIVQQDKEKEGAPLRRGQLGKLRPFR